MYNPYNKYPCPNYMYTPWYNPDMLYNAQGMPQYFYQMQNQSPYSTANYNSKMSYEKHSRNNMTPVMTDYGPEPFAVNISEATKQNNNYRIALWTGDHLQLTLMSLNPGEDIGLEVHPNVDQFVRIEEGQGVVKMGDTKDTMNFEENVYDDYAFIVPAGKYHNLINTGSKPLKLYSIYAPPNHPHGTVQKTKADAVH